MKVEVPDIDLVSVVCWDASFRESFDALACALDQTLAADRYELIFVEYYERPNPRATALLAGRPNARVAVMGLPYPGRENEHVIGACINEGIRHARGDLVVVPDADVLFERDFLEEVVRQHERCEEMALYFYRMDEPKTDAPVPRTIEALRQVGRVEAPDNYGGCLSVRRKWLEAVNGFEEDPLWRGYCSPDQDAARRFKALGLAIRWHPSKFLYHGYHPGCHSPDRASLERVFIQRRIYDGRAKALETLPDRGLDPDRKPAWTYQGPRTFVGPGMRGRLRKGLRAVVHAIVPYGVRRRIVKLFSG
jgi:hypothetical protein